MKNIPQISEAELEVMKILWKLGSATSADISAQLLWTTEWKPKTIQTLITRLVAKGAVEAVNTGAKAYLYKPLVEEADYRADANESFLKKVYNGSLNMMLASFVKERKITREELEDLKKLLDEEERR